jgi:hypothetical protein
VVKVDLQTAQIGTKKRRRMRWKKIALHLLVGGCAVPVNSFNLRRTLSIAGFMSSITIDTFPLFLRSITRVCSMSSSTFATSQELSCTALLKVTISLALIASSHFSMKVNFNNPMWPIVAKDGPFAQNNLFCLLRDQKDFYMSDFGVRFRIDQLTDCIFLENKGLRYSI